MYTDGYSLHSETLDYQPTCIEIYLIRFQLMSSNDCLVLLLSFQAVHCVFALIFYLFFRFHTDVAIWFELGLTVNKRDEIEMYKFKLKFCFRSFVSMIFSAVVFFLLKDVTQFNLSHWIWSKMFNVQKYFTQKVR